MRGSVSLIRFIVDDDDDDDDYNQFHSHFIASFYFTFLQIPSFIVLSLSVSLRPLIVIHHHWPSNKMLPNTTSKWFVYCFFNNRFDRCWLFYFFILFSINNWEQSKQHMSVYNTKMNRLLYLISIHINSNCCIERVESSVGRTWDTTEGEIIENEIHLLLYMAPRIYIYIPQCTHDDDDDNKMKCISWDGRRNVRITSREHTQTYTRTHPNEKIKMHALN